MEYLVVGVRGLLGLVFLVSVGGKVAGRPAFTAFVASVRALGVLPPALVRPVARSVVAGEAVVCVLLAVPVRGAATAGFLLAALLLAAFTVGIASAVRRGRTAPCRCFGPSTAPLGTPHIVRNAVLCAAATAGALAVPMATDARSAGGMVVAGAAGLLAGALITQLDPLVSLFRPTRAPARKGPVGAVRHHHHEAKELS
ncbi:MauE/DoxX family redox-associated membrane protein [Streptomyces huasconensis]|uniref:MauE/DoxX family redox-associated membrane protein n=1 Tax=Streptomyces huasconensis TaxID=1854574 RepID=UPI0036F9E8EF